MRKTTLAVAAVLIAASVSAPAFADDFVPNCVAEVETWPEDQQAAGIDGCSCVADAMSGNADLDAEFRELQAMAADDRESAMSSEAADVVGACFG